MEILIEVIHPALSAQTISAIATSFLRQVCLSVSGPLNVSGSVYS
jgi:hypothetical protein